MESKEKYKKNRFQREIYKNRIFGKGVINESGYFIFAYFT